MEGPSFEQLRLVPAGPEPRLELVDVYASPIEKRQASVVTKAVKQAYPLRCLSHLRRVRCTEDDDQTYLHILLCRVEDCTEDGLPLSLVKVVQEHELSPFITKVPAKFPPTIRLWAEGREYWSMPWKPPKEMDTATMMTQELQTSAEKYMRRALALLESASVHNSAVIVDPPADQIVAEGLDTSSGKYPLRHAVMEGLRLAAERDRTTWPDETPEPPPKKPKIDGEVKQEEEVRQDEEEVKPQRPYLCTGYELYCVKEPCLMCAMALVHSRFRTVIFSEADQDSGAFTVHALHGKEKLNHHYYVYHLKQKSEEEGEDQTETQQTNEQATAAQAETVRQEETTLMPQYQTMAAAAATVTAALKAEPDG